MDSGTLARQIADYDAHKVTSTDALNDALKQYGVPEIRNTVAGLRTTIANTTNSLNAVDPSVTGRTQGSLVTEAQRQKQVANERAPIAQQLGTQTSALGDQQKTLDDDLQQANTLATNKVNDYNTGRAALQSQYDTTYKREQDAAAQAAEAAARRQAQANADRQYQLDVQSAQSKASSAASAAANKPASKADVSGHIIAQFNSNKGKDGFVSNETWANALNDWQSIGGTVRDFYHMYDRYVNTKYKTSYAGWNQR